GDGFSLRPGPPEPLRGDGVGQAQLVVGLRDLLRSELGEMAGLELRVEQAISAAPEPRHEMHEGDLRVVGLAVEHALAEEGAAERQPVEPADEPAIEPAFDRVDMAESEQFTEDLAYAPVDPGIGPVRLGGRAGSD